MIVFVLKIEVQPGQKEAFLKIAKQMAEESQKEAGNIEYHVYEEADEENVVAFIEKWKDQQSIDLHEKMVHFTDNIGKLKSLCAKPPIRNRFNVII